MSRWNRQDVAMHRAVGSGGTCVGDSLWLLAEESGLKGPTSLRGAKCLGDGLGSVSCRPRTVPGAGTAPFATLLLGK